MQKGKMKGNCNPGVGTAMRRGHNVHWSLDRTKRKKSGGKAILKVFGHLIRTTR